MDLSHSTRVNNRLRQARIGRNWRQRDLADQLGTTVVTVKRWERGYQQPSTYFQIKLCVLFGKSAEELGLVEGNPSLPTATQQDQSGAVQTHADGILALWTIPYPRNPHFTGRDDLLEHLARRLSSSSSEESTSTRRAVLTQPEAIKGLGGIGKTQLAVEYAYRAREQDHYTHTLWINATSEETIISSFAVLAELLPSVAAQEEKDQHKLATAVIRWLEQCQHRWLLIFDNADDLSLVQPYFPLQGNGSLLLTTRAHAVAALASPLQVEPMGMMEATHFLLHRTQRLDATDEESNEAANVAIALDGFPLALDQAGAYIEETGCRFGDYLHLYHDHRHKLLTRRGTQSAHYPHSVATTWSLSFQQIEQTNPAAADLLRLCAFLAPDHIPEELLREGAPHWPPVLQRAVTDLFTFNQMLEHLLKFSLVKRLVEENMLSIHRLVQVVQRERMTLDEQEYWACCVVYGVNAVFPGDPRGEIATWPRCQRYLEQVQICDLLIQHYKLGFSEAADVLNRAAIYLSEHALYALAEPLYQRALHIWEQQAEAGHSRIAEPLYGLARLYKEQGKYVLAEQLYQQALPIWEQQLGETHPTVASLLNSLGELYGELGRRAEAEPLFRRALQIWEQQLGEMHPTVASPLNDLALLCYEQGKYAEAEPLYLRALRIREQQLGPHHPKVALTLNNLALLYVGQARYAKAEPLYQRALRIWEQQLGETHPNVGYALNNLAILYVEQGHYAQAEALYQRGLHIREQQLGETHTSVATFLNNLGQLYIELGKHTEAETLLRRGLHIWEQQLGPEHHLVAFALNNLAKLSMKQGQYTKAESLYQRALHIREQALGSEHPQVVDTLSGLADLYFEQGKHEQAESLYVRALSIREQQLGAEHPRTATSLTNLALFYSRQGNDEQAELLLRRALSIRERVLGSDHPDTAQSLLWLATLSPRRQKPSYL
ncbi:MAG TPA: FxSxx-COOH system tetratricopeptide repeat protein [Ktedonobacteraceae bacterium]|nr:FxSxx-COOH system tetratricopeptide repeat protein [Ktedonobacteraceae bacterium]